MASKAQYGLLATSANPLHIGGDAILRQFFNGRVDEVRVYRAALSQAEIQADMAAPLGGPPDTTVPSVVSGLAASAVSLSRIDLSWSAASDNVGVTGVRGGAVSGGGVFDVCGGDDGVGVGVERYGAVGGDVVRAIRCGRGMRLGIRGRIRLWFRR